MATTGGHTERDSTLHHDPITRPEIPLDDARDSSQVIPLLHRDR